MSAVSFPQATATAAEIQIHMENANTPQKVWRHCQMQMQKKC